MVPQLTVSVFDIFLLFIWLIIFTINIQYALQFPSTVYISVFVLVLSLQGAGEGDHPYLDVLPVMQESQVGYRGWQDKVLFYYSCCHSCFSPTPTVCFLLPHCE